jgi:hypothetical protein
MAKSVHLFFFRGEWSFSELPSRRRGSSSNIASFCSPFQISYISLVTLSSPLYGKRKADNES